VGTAPDEFSQALSGPHETYHAAQKNAARDWRPPGGAKLVIPSPVPRGSRDTHTLPRTTAKPSATHRVVPPDAGVSTTPHPFMRGATLGPALRTYGGLFCRHSRAAGTKRSPPPPRCPPRMQDLNISPASALDYSASAHMAGGPFLEPRDTKHFPQAAARAIWGSLVPLL
jgi:hypothetical protein